MSDATIRGSLALLRQAFSIAVAKKKISQAPKIDLPPMPEAKEDFITEIELKKLLDVLPKHLRPYVTFLFYQGTRSKETSKIIWGQIDLERATYSPKAANTKTKDSNLRALHDEVVTALKSLKREDPAAQVFDTTNFLKAFKKACLKLNLFDARYTWQCGQCGATNDTASHKSVAPTCAGYDEEHKHVSVKMRWGYVGFTVHGFRRSAVVYYRERLIPDKTIMQITGHKTMTTFQGYSPVTLQTQQAAMRQAMNAPAQLNA